MGTGIQELLVSLLFPASFLIIMYLLIIRPHKKREKAKRDMQNSIKVGDEVITIGGIMGKVINVKDDEITIETSVEKTKIKIYRYAIDNIKSAEEK